MARPLRIRIHESFRTLFYAPLYAASRLGAFADEGLDVDILTRNAPVDSAASLDSGEAQVRWGGPIRVFLAHDRDPDSSLVFFCEAVSRDPFFLVGRTPRPDFTLRDLAGLRLAPFGGAPTPWLCLQDDLRRAGIDPSAVRRVEVGSMEEGASALDAGGVDVAQFCEPFVETALGRGNALWHAQASRGACAYTGFATTRTFLASNRAALVGLVRAMRRIQRWFALAGADRLAATVAPFFPGVPAQALAVGVKRYLALGVWAESPIPSTPGLERLKGALLSGGAMRRDVRLEACVDSSLAVEALAEPPRPLPWTL